MKSNVSLLSGQCIRDASLNEVNASAPTLKAIIASVINLGCQPSGFLRLLYCSSHGFITTCRCFCPYCNECILKGCCLDSCSASSAQQLHCDTLTRVCTHKRKTAAHGGLLTENMISIIGNMIQFGLIDQCIDITRNQMDAKIRLCTRTYQLCITCGINNMQTLIAFGEKDLASLLVSYYQEIKTPKECRSFLMDGISKLRSYSIESQYFFSSKDDISLDDQLIIMEYVNVLKDSSSDTISKGASTDDPNSSGDLIAEAADVVIPPDTSNNTDIELQRMAEELESLQRRSDAVEIEYSLVVCSHS